MLVIKPRWGSQTYQRPISKVLVTGSTVLFLTISAHWIINVVRASNALVANGGIPNGSLMSYGNIADPLDVASVGALYSFEIAVADMIMLYRLWIVWDDNRYVCAFPALSFLGFVVMGIGVTFQFTQVKPGQNVFLTECGRWIASALVLTLATNLYCSIMISYRIWSTNRGLSIRHAQSSRIIYVIVVIVESTVIYTFFSLFTLVAYLAKSNVQFVPLNATSPIIGIAFSLVIVRAGLGLGQQHMSTIHMNASDASRGHRSQTSNVPLTVNIRRQTETARTGDDVISIEKVSETAYEANLP
ncbi:hypothetical protein NM688_g2494 [Phlebia brevispora]|uniref:Uncharacterized protein n=1 Tax=Phlebia brevispora TaxID=194682 RepID=A0ACC1T8D1_9APHY|nr:hypothetical protein NM688_g2494 [Phlebia brevispora]